MDGFLQNALNWFKDHFSEWTIVKVYIGCAVAGGTVLLGQAGLNLFGIGGDTDIDADVDADDLDAGDGSANFLSIRTMSSFLTLFGLVGWYGTEAGWGSGLSALAAFAAGSSVMFLVAYMMLVFQRLQSQGNLEPKQALGKTARVYLRIPGALAGKGKITVMMQGRSVEFDAVTTGETLPSGSDCRIVEMKTEDTFLVEGL